jgi:2-aminoadipate transaminase
MADSGFSCSHLFVKDAPARAPRWTGFAKFNFVGGHNDPTLIPAAELADIASAVLRRNGPSLAMYNSDGPQGFRGLREFVVDKVSRRPAITCTPDDVLITTGSGQGIDLVNRLLLDAGDTVLVEEFSYGGVISKFKRLGVRMVKMPLDANGIRMDALAQILADLKGRGVTPKYIYTIPTIQNPTGSILPLERRNELIALSRRHGVPIFEDECYADLIWTGETPPSLYSLDPRQVIHIGSFSKTLAPALRLGYVVADWEVMGRLVALKRESDSGTGAIEQMVVAEYFSKHFGDHVDTLNKVLGEKLDTMIDALEKEFGTAVEPWRPKGGIFLWIKLPDAVDVRKLVAPAAAAGVVFNPGPEWACEGEEATSYMRLCFALPSKDVIRNGVAALARVCFEETGIPALSANVRRAASGQAG